MAQAELSVAHHSCVSQHKMVAQADKGVDCHKPGGPQFVAHKSSIDFLQVKINLISEICGT